VGGVAAVVVVAVHPELDYTMLDYTILGGPVAVSEQVKASIDDLADGEVTRVAGPTRSCTVRDRRVCDPLHDILDVGNAE
jgi:hypothetical protein